MKISHGDLEKYVCRNGSTYKVNWKKIVKLKNQPKNPNSLYDGIIEQLSTIGILCYGKEEGSYFLTEGSNDVNISNYDNSIQYTFSRPADAEEWVKIQYKDALFNNQISLNKVIKQIKRK